MYDNVKPEDWGKLNAGIAYPLTYAVAISDVYGRGKAIPAGTDDAPVSLDDYKTPGCYFCPNSTVAATITNIAEGGSGFKLIVENTVTNAAITQTFYKAARSDYFFKRSFYNGSWTSWYKYTGTEVT